MTWPGQWATAWVPSCLLPWMQVRDWCLDAPVSELLVRAPKFWSSRSQSTPIRTRRGATPRLCQQSAGHLLHATDVFDRGYRSTRDDRFRCVPRLVAPGSWAPLILVAPVWLFRFIRCPPASIPCQGPLGTHYHMHALAEVCQFVYMTADIRLFFWLYLY